MLLRYTKLNENLIEYVSDKYDHKLKRDLKNVCDLLKYTIDELYPEYNKHCDIVNDQRNDITLMRKHSKIVYEEFKYAAELDMAWFDIANRGCEHFEITAHKGDSFYKVWSDNISEISNMSPYTFNHDLGYINSYQNG